LKRNKTLIKESKIKIKKKTKKNPITNTKKQRRSINQYCGGGARKGEREKKKTSLSVTNHPSIDDMRLTT
jgi:hypothetical protein